MTNFNAHGGVTLALAGAGGSKAGMGSSPAFPPITVTLSMTTQLSLDCAPTGRCFTAKVSMTIGGKSEIYWFYASAEETWTFCPTGSDCTVDFTITGAADAHLGVLDMTATATATFGVQVGPAPPVAR